MGNLHPRKLTAEELEAMEQADRDALAEGMEAALGDLAEVEEEAARIVSRRGESILALFAAYPPDEIDRQLKKNTGAFASSFALGVSKLGALDIAGQWYRQAAAAFDAGDYGTALQSFITTGTADELAPDIDASRKDYQTKYGREMTLADFLSRFPYEWKEGDSREDLDRLLKTAKQEQLLPEKESFFDVLYRKLKRGPLPSMVTGKLFENELMPMYSTKELMAMGQVKTPKNKEAGLIPSFLVTTPAEVEYYFSALGSGYFPNIGTAELQAFCAALVALARNNPQGVDPGRADPFGYIPLAEYGELTRSKKNREEQPIFYTPREMNTPAEQAAENKKVEKRLEKLRANIRKSFEALKRAQVEFKDPKKKRGQGGPIAIIGNYSIEDIGGTEYIIVEFLQSAADAITAAGLLTMFPSKLLSIDRRNHNAFSLGLKMVFQSNYDTNVEKGTDRVLKVKTLLENAPELPKYEDLIKQGRRDWKQKILEPLEENLDALIEVEFLEEWYYTDPKTKEEITREAARSLPYSAWENLRVCYEPATEQEETRRRKRLDRIAKEKAAKEAEQEQEAGKPKSEKAKKH